jgi:hypothetical protein
LARSDLVNHQSSTSKADGIADGGRLAIGREFIRDPHPVPGPFDHQFFIGTDAGIFPR